MRLKNARRFLAAVGLGLGVFAVGVVGFGAQYSVIDLGVPDGALYSEGMDVNEVGQVAVKTSAGGKLVAEMWQNGVWTKIDTPYAYTVPEAINNLGDIVGSASGESDPVKGILWRNGSVTYLPDAPGGQDWTIAHDVNDAGLVVGYSIGDPGNLERAFAWQNGVLNNIGIVDVGFGQGKPPALPIIYSDALKVNNAGQILGETLKADLVAGKLIDTYRAWILDHGALTILPTLAGDTSASLIPYALNEHADVLASYNSLANGNFYGVWHASGIQALQALPGADAQPKAINDSRVVVGLSRLQGPPGTATDSYATLWDSAGAPIDLNDLLDASGDGWELRLANAINNKGWIVGEGINPGGQTRGFLLIPVPEPRAISECLVALFGFVVGNARFLRFRANEN